MDYVNLIYIMVSLVAAIASGIAVSKYKLSETEKMVVKMAERLTKLETWKAESQGRTMSCRNEILTRVEKASDLQSNRINGAFKRIDEVNAGLTIQIERHNNMKETLQELKSDIHDLSDNVNKILQKLGGVR